MEVDGEMEMNTIKELKAIDKLGTIEELDGYIKELNETRSRILLDDMKDVKVPPQDGYSEEDAKAIELYNQQMKRSNQYEEYALNKIKELNGEMNNKTKEIMKSNKDSTGIALKQLQKEENDRMEKMQTGMEIGERMKLKEGISVEVAHDVSERRNVREYFSIIAGLPIKETKDQANKELIYEMVKEGLTDIPTVIASEVYESNKKGLTIFGEEYEPAPYRVQQEFMKVRMLMPEAFEFDEELALSWIEQGINHEEVIERFEVMMEDSIAQEEYFKELTLNEIMFDKYEDTKNPIGKVHSELDML